jgi:hypothetical protein
MDVHVHGLRRVEPIREHEDPDDRYDHHQSAHDDAHTCAATATITISHDQILLCLKAEMSLGAAGSRAVATAKLRQLIEISTADGRFVQDLHRRTPRPECASSAAYCDG